MLLYLYLLKSLLYQPLGTQTCPNILPQLFLALFQKELSLLSSPQLIFIDIDPLFLPYLSQIFFCSLKKKKKKKLSKAILSKKFEETFIASTSLHSISIRMDRARGRESFDCGDGLHGVSTTGTPHRSHTLRNRSFHCPAYTTRFIILFIATTRNYCPSDLNPRFRFHLRPYREGPDNRPAPGLSPPTKVANEVACLIMENS